MWRDVGSSEWQQTLVAELHAGHEHSSNGGGGGAGAYLELLQPATDPLIQRCLQALAEEEEEGGGGGAPNLKQGLALSAARAWRRILGEATDEVRWLPTGCLALLDTLQRARPSHTLIAADFDRLPEVAVAGINAPLVATTVSAQAAAQQQHCIQWEWVLWGVSQLACPRSPLCSKAAPRATTARTSSPEAPSVRGQGWHAECLPLRARWSPFGADPQRSPFHPSHPFMQTSSSQPTSP